MVLVQIFCCFTVVVCIFSLLKFRWSSCSFFFVYQCTFVNIIYLIIADESESKQLYDVGFVSTEGAHKRFLGMYIDT